VNHQDEMRKVVGVDPDGRAEGNLDEGLVGGSCHPELTVDAARSRHL
jgi:hypothetical protein